MLTRSLFSVSLDRHTQDSELLFGFLSAFGLTGTPPFFDVKELKDYTLKDGHCLS